MNSADKSITMIVCAFILGVTVTMSHCEYNDRAKVKLKHETVRACLSTAGNTPADCARAVHSIEDADSILRPAAK